MEGEGTAGHAGFQCQTGAVDGDAFARFQIRELFFRVNDDFSGVSVHFPGKDYARGFHQSGKHI